MDTKLIVVHDPMCSWCWAFRPALAALLQALPWEITIERLLGGLAPDSDAPMPVETRTYVQQTWRKIEQRVPGTRFNFDFWTHCKPRRSTYPACRGVIAARQQAPAREDDMILAIQQAYYLQARNPSDDTTLLDLASEIGLDADRFRQDLDDTATQQKLEAEIARTQAIGARSFPSLVLKTDDSHWSIPVDYRGHGAMRRAIEELLEHGV